MSQDRQKGLFPSSFTLGGIIGVAVGLAASYLIDQGTSREQERAHTNGPKQRAANSLITARSQGNEGCAICLEELTHSVYTPCCNQVLHAKCNQDLKENRITACPFCRHQWL